MLIPMTALQIGYNMDLFNLFKSSSLTLWTEVEEQFLFKQNSILISETKAEKSFVGTLLYCSYSENVNYFMAMLEIGHICRDHIV